MIKWDKAFNIAFSTQELNKFQLLLNTEYLLHSISPALIWTRKLELKKKTKTNPECIWRNGAPAFWMHIYYVYSQTHTQTHTHV